MKILLICQLLCLIMAIVHKGISYSKKEDIAHKHYTLMSEIWVVALIIIIAITSK